MSRCTTPKYRVEVALASPRWAATPGAWRREYGRPGAEALARWIAQHNASLAPGEANAHLGAEHRVIGARIVRQADGRVMAEVGCPAGQPSGPRGH